MSPPGGLCIQIEILAWGTRLRLFKTIYINFKLIPFQFLGLTRSFLVLALSLPESCPRCAAAFRVEESSARLLLSRGEGLPLRPPGRRDVRPRPYGATPTPAVSAYWLGDP